MTSKLFTRPGAAWAIRTFVLMIMVRPAAAVTFEVELPSGFGLGMYATTENEQMIEIVRAAAAHWERIFSDQGGHYEVKCEFNYDSKRTREFEVNKSGNYTLKFFYDGTSPYQVYYFGDPCDHSEFLIEQGLYSQLPFESEGTVKKSPSGNYGSIGCPPEGCPEITAEDYIGGDPNADLEVRLAGKAVTGHQAGRKVDLYTHALRGLAAVMGFRTTDVGSSEAESHLCGGSNKDGYHILDALGAGTNLVVDVNGTACPGTPFINNIDLEVDSLLVNEGYSVGWRYLPSTVDIVVLATINGWSDYGLTKSEMLPKFKGSTVRGGATVETFIWHVPFNWSGHFVPDEGTNASLTDSGLGEVILLADATAGGLRIQSGNELSTGNHDLTVEGGIEVFDGESALNVESGGEVHAQTLSIETGVVNVGSGASLELDSCGEHYASINEDGALAIGGEVDMGSGNVDVLYGTLELLGGLLQNGKILDNHRDYEPGTKGIVRGTGNIICTETIMNSGLVKPDQGGILLLKLEPEPGILADPKDDSGVETAGGPGLIDLDGVGLGEIDATDGSLFVDGPIADPFDGYMEIEPGQFVKLNNDWIVGEDGVVETVIGVTPALKAKLIAPITTVAGEITVGGRTDIESEIRFIDATSLIVAKPLTIVGDVTYAAPTGTYSGTSTLVQKGDVTVETDTVMGVALYVWDGNATFSTTVNANTNFAITGTVVGSGGIGGTDGYDGTVTVKTGARLVHSNGWKLDGKLTLDGGFAKITNTSTTLTVATVGKIEGFGTICANIANSGVIAGTTAGSIVIYGKVTGTGTVDSTTVLIKNSPCPF